MTAHSWIRSTQMRHTAFGAIGEISTPEKADIKVCQRVTRVLLRIVDDLILTLTWVSTSYEAKRWHCLGDSTQFKGGRDDVSRIIASADKLLNKHMSFPVCRDPLDSILWLCERQWYVRQSSANPSCWPTLHKWWLCYRKDFTISFFCCVQGKYLQDEK